MSSIHQIRLRGPWQLWLARDSQHPPAAETAWEPWGRFEAPDGLTERLPPGYSGPVRLERSFHRPTGLDERTRVVLCTSSPQDGQIALNGSPLGLLGTDANRHDITAQLQTRNRICIDLILDHTASLDPPTCDVRLEILPPQ